MRGIAMLARLVFVLCLAAVPAAAQPAAAQPLAAFACSLGVRATGAFVAAAAVYRQFGRAFQFPPYFGDNPDALWDALGDYAGEPVAIIWRNAARSAQLLGAGFGEIIAVLQRAVADGRLTLELA